MIHRTKTKGDKFCLILFSGVFTGEFGVFLFCELSDFLCMREQMFLLFRLDVCSAIAIRKEIKAYFAEGIVPLYMKN